MAKNTAIERIADDATSLTADVRKYTHQVWLAGLGAYARVSKEGAGYFKTLIAEGEVVEAQGKKLIATQVDAVDSKVERFKERLQAGSGGRFGRIEQAFDKRVAAALSRIGIPGKKDIDRLSAKLDDLNAALQSLQGK